MSIQQSLQCLALALILIGSGCSSRSDQKIDDEEILFGDEKFTAEQIALIGELPRYFGTPLAVTLFEGMPHPLFEEELLAQEVSKNPPMKIDGEKFYKLPRILTEADKAEFLALASAVSTHKPFMWGKLCGGFHADYALRWKARGRTITVLVCLGCHEMVIFGLGSELRTDISNDAHTRLKTLLTKYQKLRPKSDHFR